MLVTRPGGTSSGVSATLLGKRLNGQKANRKDVKYRKLQARVYNFLERPTGKKAGLYHACV